MDVVLVRWPEESERLEHLRADDTPRLLLTSAGGPAPEVDGCLEDWIRLPAEEDDVRARVRGLERRAETHHRELPELDDDGVLRCHGAWVALPPVEARLFSALLERFGRVTTRAELNRAGWPEGAPDRNVLDVHILHLRRKTGPLGLAIRTIRSRGYLLETTGVPQEASNGAAHERSRAT